MEKSPVPSGFVGKIMNVISRKPLWSNSNSYKCYCQGEKKIGLAW